MGIGGGIIKRKLLFAVLLVTTMSLAGVAGASAANLGTAKIQTNHINIVHEKVNIQANNTGSTNKSTVTQKYVDKIVKNTTNKQNNIQITTPTRNYLKHKKTHSNKTVKIYGAAYNKLNSKNDNTVKTTIQSTLSALKNITNSNQTQQITVIKQIKSKPNKTVKINGSSTVKTTVKHINKAKTINTSTQPKFAAGETKTKNTTSSTSAPFLAAGSPSTTKVPVSLQKYLEATKNCQVNNAQIKSLSKRIISGKTSTYAKAAAIFDWVRDKIGYSFYYNTRKGAVGTLNARTGNCVDTAHLVIALERAAGIPARYVSANARFRSGHVYGHVWAGVYVNGKWYVADATSSRNSFGVVKSWTSATIKGKYASLPF